MNEKVILVLAKSRVRFEEALGRTLSLEDAIAQERAKIAKTKQVMQEETWVDITTGQRFKGQF
jgi:hypothetical protein